MTAEARYAVHHVTTSLCRHQGDTQLCVGSFSGHCAWVSPLWIISIVHELTNNVTRWCIAISDVNGSNTQKFSSYCQLITSAYMYMHDCMHSLVFTIHELLKPHVKPWTIKYARIKLSFQAASKEGPPELCLTRTTVILLCITTRHVRISWADVTYDDLLIFHLYVPYEGTRYNRKTVGV